MSKRIKGCTQGVTLVVHLFGYPLFNYFIYWFNQSL